MFLKKEGGRVAPEAGDEVATPASPVAVENEVFQNRRFPALVELHDNLHRLLLNAFARRYRELLTLLPCLLINRRVLFLSRAIAVIHILLYGYIILFNVFYHIILKCPFEKIQLTDRGLNGCAVFIGDINSVPSTKRVESFFTVCAKLQLVIHIYFESFYLG